jgi:hypothetical protein
MRTLVAVAERIKGQRKRGAIVRDDFADSANGDAAALFEAVVAAAAQSAEDRKCEVIANVYASILTEPHISIDDALLYLRRIRGSSWRQLVALQCYWRETARASVKLSFPGGARTRSSFRRYRARASSESELAFGWRGRLALWSNVAEGGRCTRDSRRGEAALLDCR